MAQQQHSGNRVIAVNRAARHDYFVLEAFEAGIELTGTEVKSVRNGAVTLVPLQLYFKGPRVKVELGLCRGKKLYDKRADAAARDARREMDRAMKERNRQ